MPRKAFGFSFFCSDRSQEKQTSATGLSSVLRALTASNSEFAKVNMDIALIASYGFTELSFEVRLKTLKKSLQKLES